MTRIIMPSIANDFSLKAVVFEPNEQVTPRFYATFAV